MFKRFLAAGFFCTSHGNQIGAVNYWLSKKNRLWARAGLTPDDGSEYFVSFHLLDSELGHSPATNEYRGFFTQRR